MRDKVSDLRPYQVRINVLLPAPLLDKLGIRPGQLVPRAPHRRICVCVCVCVQRREHLLVCPPQRIDQCTARELFGRREDQRPRSPQHNRSRVTGQRLGQSRMQVVQQRAAEGLRRWVSGDKCLQALK